MRRQLRVTLTSIPPRFGNVPARIRAIERQTRRPERVQVTLPRKYRRFPGERPSLPPLPDWVEIFECAEDHGPATKLLPAVRRWQGTPTDLLVCDDDRTQDRRWIERLNDASGQRPGEIVCERGWNILDRFGLEQCSPRLPRAEAAPRGGRTMGYRLLRAATIGLLHPSRKIYSQAGYVDIFEGFLGAIIPVEAIPLARACNIPGALWTVDDVWLSGIAASSGVGVWVHDTPRPVYSDGAIDRLHALRHHVENGVGRDAADRMAVEYMRDNLGVWT